jgi:hypothetical protein
VHAKTAVPCIRGLQERGAVSKVVSAEGTICMVCRTYICCKCTIKLLPSASYDTDSNENALKVTTKLRFGHKKSMQ